MAAVRIRPIPPLYGYVAAPFAVAVTTWGLLAVQDLVMALGHFPYLRPFDIGFMLPIAILTGLAGRGPGFFSLALSLVSAVTFLSAQPVTKLLAYPSISAELILLCVVGTLMVVGMTALHDNVRILADAEEARTRLRTVMDTAPVGILLADMNGRLVYANPEMERLWGQPLARVGMDGWDRYKIYSADGEPLDAKRRPLGRVLLKQPPITQVEHQFERPDGTRSWVESSALLIQDASGKPLGALAIHSDFTARKLVEQERQELLQREKARADREALINRVGQALRTSPDPEVIQRTAMSVLGEALHADRCFYAIYRRAGEMWIGRDWHRPDLAPMTGEYEVSEMEIRPEDLFPGGQTAVEFDVLQKDLPAKALAAFAAQRLRSVLSVPLYDGARLVASLTVAMADQTRAWTPEEIALVETIASQTRAAVDSARLLQRDHNIAERLQVALQPPLQKPPSLDVAEAYRAALDEAYIGGDFFDIFPVSPGVFALLVGDVSGKGLDAAAQVATIRNMLRYALYRGRSLSDAVTELNNVVAEHALLAGFATLFVGIYDISAHLLTYVSCGQEPALLRRAQTNQIEELPPTGPPLGVSDKASFLTEVVMLRREDALLIYTDGASEAGPNRRDMLGTEGLMQLLAAGTPHETAADIVNRVFEGAVHYAQDLLRDDICLIAAVVQGD